jgi:FtsP/CotA-like multicopper oxidase with cupredoxin domain
MVAVGLFALALLAGSVPTVAGPRVLAQPFQACDDPTSSMSLYAENIGKNRIGYGLTPKTASIPGPTIVMTEGDCKHVTLVNDTKARLSMHAHGVAYSVASDGTRLNKGCVAPGRSRTYVFSAPGPTTRTDGTLDPGTAGYWHYHDHCLGTPHGTGGINKGLFGALIVRRAGDPVPDKPPFVVVFKGTTINLKKAPHTPVFQANEGERVEFVVIGHGELFHTFHLHGHRWVDNRTGLPTGAENDRIIDNKTLGPADSFGFQVIAGEHVGPGAWMYHCHVQGHSDAGMSGIFMVKTPGGQVTEAARATMREWRRSHAHMDHHHH